MEFFGPAVLVLLSTVAASTQQWSPVINHILKNGTLYVTVKEVLPNTNHIRLCLDDTAPDAPECDGHVEEMETASPSSARFKVTGLRPNRTYFILIRPYDRNNRALENWIYSTNRVTIPLTTPVTETTTTASRNVTSESVDVTVVLVIFVSLMALLLLTGVLLMVAWRRGYWRKIRRLRCYGQHSRRIKVMQIYLSENQEFRKFVQAHMDFLGKIVDVESLDCNLARNYKNPDGWMKSMIAKHHVLIYLSPTLGERLKKIEENPHSEDHGTTHLNLCGKAVERLRKRSHRSLCFRGLRTRAAFVVSGCFNTDQEHSAYLSRQRWFGVPCFRVMSEDVRSLESPRELVQVLCGGRKGVTCRTFDWANTAQADKLRHQAYQLKVHLDEVRVHAERSADRGMNNEHPLHMNPAGHGMYDAHLLHMNPVGRGMNDEHVLHMNPADRGMNDGHVLHRNLAGLGMNNEHLPHWNPAGRGMNNGHPPYVDPAGRRMNQEHLFHINPAGRGMNDEYLPHMNPAGRGMNDEHLPRMNLVGRGVNNEHQPRTDVNERCMPSEMNASGDKEQVRGLLSNGYAAGVQCTEPPGGTGTDSGFSSDPRSNSNRIASNDPRGRFNVQPRPCADEESSAERDALIGRHTAGACNSSNPSPPSFFGPDDGASEISSRSGMSECFRRVNDRSGWHRPP